MLDVTNNGSFSDVISNIENEFQTVLKQFQEKKNCSTDQKKFSHYNEAFILASNLSDNSDEFAALAQFETSAELGLALAHNECGLIYENSDIVTQDWLQAVYHYENADRYLLSYGSFNLGWMNELGRGAKENKAKTITCYMKSAYQGCPEAQYHLAQKYENGFGPQKKNIEQALYWYDQAIIQNYSDAIFHKGWLYEKALGLPRNLSLAAKHYLLGAKQNDFKKIASGALYFLIENPDFKPDDVDKIEITNLLNMRSNGQTNNENATDRIEFANRLMESGYLSDAIEKYGKIIELYPTDAKTYLARAKAYAKEYRYKNLALIDLEKAIEIEPRSVETLKRLIEICDQLDENKKVIYYCNKLFEIDDKKYSNYYYFRGTAYADLKQYREAINDYSTYIKDHPTDANAYTDRALAYTKINWRRKAQEDKIHAMKVMSNNASKPHKSSRFPSIPQTKSLTDNNEEIPKNLLIFIQSLYVIGHNPQLKNRVILQLIPINEIATLLMKQIRSNNTQHQFHIHDLAKLQEIVLITTQTLLKKCYENVIIQNGRIEITLTDKGHKVIKGKPEKDLQNLKDAIIEALPEHQIYQQSTSLKQKCHKLINDIAQFEKCLAITLQNVKDAYAKKRELIDSIKTYNGNSEKLKSLIQQIQNTVKKIEQFITEITDLLSKPIAMELDNQFQSFVNQPDNEFIKSIQPFLQELETNHKVYTKLQGFKYTGQIRSLIQLIGQFHTTRSAENKKIDTLNEEIVPSTNQDMESKKDDKKTTVNIQLSNNDAQLAPKKHKHKKKLKKVTQANHQDRAVFDNPLVLFPPTTVASPQTQKLAIGNSFINQNARDAAEDDPLKAAKEFLQQGRNDEIVVSRRTSNVKPIGPPCK